MGHIVVPVPTQNLDFQLLLLPIQCSPLIEYYRTIAHTGCDNKGAKIIYRCKLKTV
jgi:hypothetical protein